MLVQNRIADTDTAEAAWLYYVGNLSQQAVSERLGISRFKVLRMLADARDQGLVRISLEHRTARTLALAERLVEAFGLEDARVAPLGPGETDEAMARRAVAILGAGYLARIAAAAGPGPGAGPGAGAGPEAGAAAASRTIGVGWGRTLSAMADSLAGVQNPGLTFVSMMGSVSRASHTAPGDVCVRLAAQTGGQAILMPAPFVADSAEACAAILSQRLVREAMGIARRADHCFMSVGECRPGAILFDSGLFTPAHIAALEAADVVGDCCGLFFRADGSLAEIELNRATPSLDPEALAATDAVLLAGGIGKLPATRAVLRAGFVRRLFVDEALATALLEVGGEG